MTGSAFMPPRDDFQPWNQPMHPMQWQTIPAGIQYVRNGHAMLRHDLPTAMPAAYKQDDTDSRGNQPRPQRAQQACVSCRQKKTRCSEDKPKCNQCQTTNSDCVYSNEVIPTKKQQTITDISDRLASLEVAVKTLTSRMEKIFSAVEAGQFPSSQPSHRSTAAMSPEHSDNPSAPPAKQAVQPTQSTPAHKLVQYTPALEPFYRTVGRDDYVTSGEYSRDTLAKAVAKQRMRNKLMLVKGFPTLGSQNIPVAMSDSESLSSASSGLAGSFASCSSATSPGLSFPDSANYTEHSNLALAPAEAKSIFRQYLQQIHVMYPVIDAPKIESIVNTFILDKRFDSTPMQRDFSNSSAQSSSSSRKKRKQSPTKEEFSPASTNGNPISNDPAEIALALLVVAIGKICAPGAPQASSAASSRPSTGIMPELYPPFFQADSFVTVNSWPQQGSVSHSFDQNSFDANSFGSFQSNDGMSANVFNNNPAADDSSDFTGLAFYGRATQLLGELHGETGLAYVHALLLAGIYCALLVRPVESAQWINMAATRMQEILHLNPGAMVKSRHDAHLDSIRLAYWTCLQLESDLHAELDLPQSGISRLEDKVPLPKGPLQQGKAYRMDMEEVMFYFIKQIELRRLFNHAQAELNDANGSQDPQHTRQMTASLEEWRQNLAFRNYPADWDDNELPAANILAARLRANFYSACYTLNRPILQRALAMFHRQPGPESDHIHDNILGAISAFPSAAAWTEVSDVEAYQIGNILGLDQAAIESCRKCIHSAKKSTEAFDGLSTMQQIPQRLHVTNVFGTAQSQFSNILVLGAVVRNDCLAWLIPGDEFRHLLQRTMSFIANLTPYSPTMRCNLEVLSEVDRLTKRADTDCRNSTVMGSEDNTIISFNDGLVYG